MPNDRTTVKVDELTDSTGRKVGIYLDRYNGQFHATVRGETITDRDFIACKDKAQVQIDAPTLTTGWLPLITVADYANRREGYGSASFAVTRLYAAMNRSGQTVGAKWETAPDMRLKAPTVLGSFDLTALPTVVTRREYEAPVLYLPYSEALWTRLSDELALLNQQSRRVFQALGTPVGLELLVSGGALLSIGAGVEYALVGDKG